MPVSEGDGKFTLKAFKISSIPTANDLEMISASTSAVTTRQYLRYSDEQYTYNLAAKSLGQGQFRLEINLNDGGPFASSTPPDTATIGVKK